MNRLCHYRKQSEFDVMLQKKLADPTLVTDLDLMSFRRPKRRASTATRVLSNHCAIACGSCSLTVRTDLFGRHKALCDLLAAAKTSSSAVDSSSSFSAGQFSFQTQSKRESSAASSTALLTTCSVCNNLYSEFVINLHQSRCLKRRETKLSKHL